jgi:hypothetical protein
LRSDLSLGLLTGRLSAARTTVVPSQTHGPQLSTAIARIPQGYVYKSKCRGIACNFIENKLQTCIHLPSQWPCSPQQWHSTSFTRIPPGVIFLLFCIIQFVHSL